MKNPQLSAWLLMTLDKPSAETSQKEILKQMERIGLIWVLIQTIIYETMGKI